MSLSAEEYLKEKQIPKLIQVSGFQQTSTFVTFDPVFIVQDLLEEYVSIKTKELEKQLQKEAMKQLSLLDQIKELEDENKELRYGIELLQKKLGME